jgi:hypothetical protein
MRDFDIQGPRTLQPEPRDGDGITAYLHTMFAVAHRPGMCHWCTPGHNRGSVSEALTLATPSDALLTLPAARATRILHRAMNPESSDD